MHTSICIANFFPHKSNKSNTKYSLLACKTSHLIDNIIKKQGSSHDPIYGEGEKKILFTYWLE